MGSTPNNGTFYEGSPLLGPVVLYGANGKPISSTNPLDVDVDVQVNTPTASTSALSSVGASVTSVLLLAANSNRKGFSITNDGSGNLYIAFGSTPTTTSYKYKLTPNALLESGSPLWTGAINGIWDVANGNARISEES